MNAGAVNGYCAVFGAISQDFSERGASPRHERIERGALKFASDATACVNHVRFTRFAFSSDGSLEFGADKIGLWFRATLPETAAGFGIRNGLTGGRCIGASIEIDRRVARYDEGANVEIVTSGLVTGIALVERPIFPQARAWLDGEMPNDPWGKELQSSFNARNRRKPEQILIYGMQPLAFAHSRGIFR
jgi:phage head maturation protease